MSMTVQAAVLCVSSTLYLCSMYPFACTVTSAVALLQVLNYGQSVFEGMKAQRSTQDRIVLFRPQQNAARMAEGADRLVMPAPPTDLFVGAIQQLVRENQDYVPPQGKGSLYIRPLLMGSGGILGLGPAPSYTFTVFCAAVGAYFKVRSLLGFGTMLCRWLIKLLHFLSLEPILENVGRIGTNRGLG